MNKCKHPNCYNDPESGRKECRKCRQRIYREKNKLKATYAIVRDNAKRRGIEFTLTVEQFRSLCKETGYIELKGIDAEDMSLDRINPAYGYTLGNVQVITLAENSAKGNRERKKLPWRNRVDREQGDPF